MTLEPLGAWPEMPRYVCDKEFSDPEKKEVGALKIAAVIGDQIRFQDEGYSPIAVGGDYIEKHKPEHGGYYIAYEDGHAGYGPEEAFDRGYALVE